MTDFILPRQWLRRYKFFLFVILLFLTIQVILAYLLRIFGSSDDIYDYDNNRLLIKNYENNDKLPFNEGFNENPLDDEDINNSNSIFNLKNSVAPKLSSNAKEEAQILNNNINNENSNNNNITTSKSSNTLNNNTQEIDSHLDKLHFQPICDIITKEAISAIHRAQSQICKQIIVNASCAIQNGVFYATKLPNYCPNDPFTPYRALGCHKDDKKFRTLSGYYINLKTTNTPTKCVDLCLQSGFVYAGVQYSSECFCGNTLPEENRKLPDPECNYKCSGDQKQICGGYFTINIYETGIRKFSPQIADLIPNSNDEKVRIAFLLTLNGRAVRQVYRLLKTLYSSNHFYYIHVDSRQSYMYRELLKLEENATNIRLAKKRYSTIWGGASLLKMLLASMTELLDNNKWNWDFVINLSESDFLIKTPQNLVDFLTANRNRNFVKSHGREVQRFIQKQGLDKTFVECDTHMWRIGDRELPRGIQIDGGSDWVALSRPFVKYVTDTANQDELIKGLLQVFHHTLLPAESFFHTALRNSKFCDTYVDNNLHVTNWKRRLGCKCQYKHVVDWCGCSPNDFKPDDWPRLLATESKQLFFARKFEPIISQAVILQLEEWLFGLYPKDYPNLHNYWQSVYNAKDEDLKIDEALLIVASSLISKRLPNNYDLDSILEITTFMNQDQYKGFLIHHEISSQENDSLKIELETWASPKQFYEVSRESIIGKRLKNIEVSSEYDQKEQISRNFAKIMDIHTEPNFILHLSMPMNDAKTTSTNTKYNLTVLWISPIGHLSDISEIYVDGSHPSINAFFVKSSLKSPLLPGVWTAKLVHKKSLVARCNFLIIPNISKVFNASLDLQLFTGQYASSKKNTQLWKEFLPNETTKNSLESNLMANLKTNSGLEQIEWINKLIHDFFTVQDTCILTNIENVENLQQCSQTSWSSFAPDPKSDIFTEINRLKLY